MNNLVNDSLCKDTTNANNAIQPKNLFEKLRDSLPIISFRL
jgi:hypothetical protein